MKLVGLSIENSCIRKLVFNFFLDTSDIGGGDSNTGPLVLGILLSQFALLQKMTDDKYHLSLLSRFPFFDFWS